MLLRLRGQCQVPVGDLEKEKDQVSEKDQVPFSIRMIYIYYIYNVAGILLSSPSYNMQIICLSLDKIGVQGLAATV